MQGLHSRKLQNGKFSDDDDDDVASAPPFCGSAQEIKQAVDKNPASRINSTLHAADSPEIKTVPTIKPEDKTGNENKSDHFVRSVQFFCYYSLWKKSVC